MIRQISERFTKMIAPHLLQSAVSIWTRLLKMAVQLEVIENDRRTNLSSEELNENQITDKLELRRLVRLKTFYNIINDPPALCFVITLIVLVLCCPLLALYIKQATNLPDFDTMKVK